MRLRIKQEGPARFIIETGPLGVPPNMSLWHPVDVRGRLVESHHPRDIPVFRDLEGARKHAKALIEIEKKYPTYHEIE